MLEFAHVLTGAAIAHKVPSPWIALPLSLLSHFLVDLLPHWNPMLKKGKRRSGLFYLPPRTVRLIILDSLLGLFLGLFLAFRAFPDFNRTLLILAGAFFAVLPDLAEAPYLFLGHKSRLASRLIAFQKKHQGKVPFLFGILFQILYATLLLFWVL